jgi:hypothetical protein
MATSESTTKQQIDDVLDTLSPRDQARVLAYARSLNELPEEAAAMTRIYEEIGVLRDSGER